MTRSLSGGDTYLGFVVNTEWCDEAAPGVPGAVLFPYVQVIEHKTFLGYHKTTSKLQFLWSVKEKFH